MASSVVKVEDRIVNALCQMQKDKSPNVACTARLFGVPEQRLRARWKERKLLTN